MSGHEISHVSNSKSLRIFARFVLFAAGYVASTAISANAITDPQPRAAIPATATTLDNIPITSGINSQSSITDDLDRKLTLFNTDDQAAPQTDLPTKSDSINIDLTVCQLASSADPPSVGVPNRLSPIIEWAPTVATSFTESSDAIVVTTDPSTIATAASEETGSSSMAPFKSSTVGFTSSSIIPLPGAATIGLLSLGGLAILLRWHHGATTTEMNKKPVSQAAMVDVRKKAQKNQNDIFFR